MANVGPVFGQVNHFRNYAQTKVAYATERFVNEAHRLYGVMEKRFQEYDFLAGRYSIADIATWPWACSYQLRGIDIEEFPRVKAWIERVGDRPGVKRGAEVGKDLRPPDYDLGKDLEAEKILFGQRARY